MNAVKGYRTLLFGALVAVFGFLQTFDWTSVTKDPKILGLITSGIGAVVIVLRYVTTTAVGKQQ